MVTFVSTIMQFTADAGLRIKGLEKFCVTENKGTIFTHRLCCIEKWGRLSVVAYEVTSTKISADQKSLKGYTDLGSIFIHHRLKVSQQKAPFTTYWALGKMHRQNSEYLLQWKTN